MASVCMEMRIWYKLGHKATCDIQFSASFKIKWERARAAFFFISENFLFVLKIRSQVRVSKLFYWWFFFLGTSTLWKPWPRVSSFQHQNPHKGSGEMVTEMPVFQETLWEEDNPFNAEGDKMAQQVKVCAVQAWWFEFCPRLLHIVLWPPHRCYSKHAHVHVRTLNQWVNELRKSSNRNTGPVRRLSL